MHKPARHAVAHLLQRAANRLDGTPAPVAPPIQYANLPCAPTLADAGGGGGGDGVPTIGGLGLSSFAGPASNSFGDASHPGNGITLANGGGGGGGFFGGGGGGGVTLPPPGSPPGLPPVSAPGTGAGSVPDPETWALLATGFTVVGVGLRYKRLLTI